MRQGRLPAPASQFAQTGEYGILPPALPFGAP